MKNNYKRLIGAMILLLAILAACDNSTETNAKANAQSDSENVDANTSGDGEEGKRASVDSEEVAQEDQEEKADSTEGASKEEAVVSKKEEYIEKLDDMAVELEQKYVNAPSNELEEAATEKYHTWDDALNEIYGVLKEQLATEEMAQLRNEQRDWIDYRDKAASESAKKYEGGSLEPIEYAATLATLTKDRCYELVENYML